MRAPSLRARLLLGVVLLATIGLVTTDAMTYTSLRTFLLQRADDSVAAADTSLAQGLTNFEALANPNRADSLASTLANSGYCAQLRGSNGQAVLWTTQCLSEVSQSQLPSSPQWPAIVSVPRKTTARRGERVSYFTVPAVEGGTQYRIRASIEPAAPKLILLIAAPLTGVTGTLHRLLVIEVVVTVAVLVALAVLGLWVVRIGLRPLEAIGRTAAAISQGDLTQRIEGTNDKSEIGRLGGVLNAMLSQIESAFLAREATERKLRRFVADASHELRTPLAAVRAYAELFSRGAAERPDDLKRSMAGITRESERMSGLIDELILLSHLDDGRPLLLQAVDLEGVVTESVETAQAVEPERPFIVESEPLLVTGDHERLRELVDNLLANTRAHTPPMAEVRVALHAENSNAVLSVSDSGPGLSADEMEHVFERFYRADVSRSRASGGSGLGLAIVSAVAEAHGGTAAVASEPGGGATFTITLPLA